MQHLLSLNTWGFLYRRRKFSKGPARWLGAEAVALWGESAQPRLAGEDMALGTKTERGTLEATKNFLPLWTGKQGDRLFTESVQSLSLRFSRPDRMKPWAIWSHLTAAPAFSWSWSGAFLSFLAAWIILWFISSFFWKSALSNLKYTETFRSLLTSPNLNHFPNLFAILFLYVILLNFIWLISSSSDLFSALTPFWEDLNFWIFLREHWHPSKPQHGAGPCRLPQHVQSICA